ncbi:MAG: septum formation initiator family protein, partial [Candidatus Woesearchaeota archaeon]
MIEKHDTIIALKMAEFNRKKMHSFWYSPLALLVLFFILVVFAYSIIGLIEKEREVSEKKDLVLSQIDTLRNRENLITKDIEKLKTSEGIEETIRDKYQVVKEGEKMVVIVDQEKKEDNIVPVDIVRDHSFFGWIKKM